MTKVCLSRQNLCREKVFVTASIQNYACHDKHNFVTTSILLSQPTHVCRDKTFVATKIILWQLPPVIPTHPHTDIPSSQLGVDLSQLTPPNLAHSHCLLQLVFLLSNLGAIFFQVSPLNLASIVYPDWHSGMLRLHWPGATRGCLVQVACLDAKVPEHRADQDQIYSSGCARHSACCLSADMCIAHVLAAGTHTDTAVPYCGEIISLLLLFLYRLLLLIWHMYFFVCVCVCNIIHY